MEHTGWSEQEVRNVLRSVTAKNPDELGEMVPKVIEWCHRIEINAAVVDLLKTLPDGTIRITFIDGEPSIQLAPDCTIMKRDGGYVISQRQEN